MSSPLDEIASVRPVGACNKLVWMVPMALLSMSIALIFASFGYAQSRTVFSQPTLDAHDAAKILFFRGWS
jgi:hypothetical protein